MASINFSSRTVTAKIVYYGPGLGGKTTNLEQIYSGIASETRGEMVTLATDNDRTLFFDLLPIDIGQLSGFETRVQLYTVPGQVYYQSTRKLVLRGVDGVVFVADSQRPMLDSNLGSLHDLEENLAAMGIALEEIPIVLQYNKRDLPDLATVAEMDDLLNGHGWPRFESCAIKTEGVFETLRCVSQLVLLSLRKQLDRGTPWNVRSDDETRATSTPHISPPPEPSPTPEPSPAPEPAPVQPAAQEIERRVDFDLDAVDRERARAVSVRLRLEDASGASIAPDQDIRIPVELFEDRARLLLRLPVGFQDREQD